MLSYTKSRLSAAKAGFAGKNFSLLFIAFLLLQFTTLAQESWFWQNPFPTAHDLFAVDFTDASTGTAVGDYGTIIRTTDEGIYNVEFSANNLTSGIYIYRMQAGNYVQMKKMILMK